MCNACGFYCCASDVFSSCGCEWCPMAACQPDDDEFGDSEFDYECQHDKPVQGFICLPCPDPNQ